MLFIDFQSYCKCIFNKLIKFKHLKKYSDIYISFDHLLCIKHSVLIKHNVKNANIVYWNSSDMIHIIQLGKNTLKCFYLKYRVYRIHLSASKG